MPRATHSDIWNEFSKNHLGDATCKVCGRIFTRAAGSSTTFLWSHLKHHHKEVYAKYKNDFDILSLPTITPKSEIKTEISEEYGEDLGAMQMERIEIYNDDTPSSSTGDLGVMANGGRKTSNGITNGKNLIGLAKRDSFPGMINKKAKIDKRQFRIGRSCVWKAFRKVNDINKGQAILCTECGKVLRKGKDSTTSFMWSHLRTHHYDKYVELKTSDTNDSVTDSITTLVSIQNDDNPVSSLVSNVHQEELHSSQEGHSNSLMEIFPFQQLHERTPSISDQNHFSQFTKPETDPITTKVDIGNDISHLFLQQSQQKLSAPKFKFPILQLSMTLTTRDDYKIAYNSWRLHCMQREIYFRTYGIMDEEVKKSTFLMYLSAEAFLMIKKSFEDEKSEIRKEISYNEFQKLLDSTPFDELVQRIEAYLS